MFKVPERVLQKLICALCGGYLSTRPIVINNNEEQICGKCFKILPDDKKSDCLRQTGLEAVAEVLIFPCRYNLQGCNYVFLWDNEKDHESKCPYRYNTLPVDDLINFDNNGDKSATEPESEHTWESDEIKLRVKCENVSNIHFTGDDQVRLKVDITGNKGHKLCITKLPKSLDKSEIALSIESLLSLKESPEVAYCYVSIENARKQKSNQEEHVYEAIPYICNVKCNKCQKIIIQDEIYHCLFGHNACKNCKGAPCLICGRQIIGESRFHCKNFLKGCTDFFGSSDIKKHEIDCEFNDFNCPLQDCNFSNSLSTVIQHFVTNHENDVVFSNKFSVHLENVDRNFYFHCYNCLFHCKYYYFNDFVEFVMKYIGSNDDAINYKYQVNVKCDYFKGNPKRQSNCLGWNEVFLEKAVVFELKGNKKIKFDADIAIIK